MNMNNNTNFNGPCVRSEMYGNAFEGVIYGVGIIYVCIKK